MNNVLKSKRKIALILFIIANISGVLNSLVYLTTSRATGSGEKIIQVVASEFTGSYSAMLLAPVVLFLLFRHPLTKYNLHKTLPAYIITALALGLMHTWIMYVSRVIISDLAGWGNYCYGNLLYRYMMETLKLTLGYVILYVCFGFYKSSKERQEQKIRAVKLEEQLARTRLELLTNQINPHFLFNTLNMISSVMFENVQAADKMIANLSDMLRATLKQKGGGIHPLKDEIRTLNYYNEIMKARYKDSLEILYKVKNECMDFPVPSFILQPLVENSIKYGMERLSPLKIIIGADVTDHKLNLFIKDNGPGIPVMSADILKSGIGLSNIQDRLESLYSSNFKFNWENLKDGGLIFTIIIPPKL